MTGLQEVSCCSSLEEKSRKNGRARRIQVCAVCNHYKEGAAIPPDESFAIVIDWPEHRHFSWVRRSERSGRAFEPKAASRIGSTGVSGRKRDGGW
jgi:hypothetical protein